MDGYEKIEKLGQGGQGKVYKVRRKADGNIFVLKSIKCGDKSCLKRAQTEVDIMKDVKHAHIVRLEESFEYKGAKDLYLCIVMEFCPGGDLYQLFRKAKKGLIKPFSEGILIKWIIQISSALQYLHEKDLWHRDIKTGNILFDTNGNLKLGDFGLSATYNRRGHDTVVGTPFYYAPEVMLGKSYTNKIDIWNLGVCVLELVSLKMQPINAEVLNDKEGCSIALGTKTALKIQSEAIEKGYSKKFALLLCSMLSRHAQNRPSAREILQILCYEKESELFTGEASNTAACEALRSHLTKLPIFQSPQNLKRKEKEKEKDRQAKRYTLPAAIAPLDPTQAPEKYFKKSKTSPLHSPRGQAAGSPRDDSVGHSNTVGSGSRGSDCVQTPRNIAVATGHRDLHYTRNAGGQGTGITGIPGVPGAGMPGGLGAGSPKGHSFNHSPMGSPTGSPHYGGSPMGLHSPVTHRSPEYPKA